MHNVFQNGGCVYWKFLVRTSGENLIHSWTTFYFWLINIHLILMSFRYFSVKLLIFFFAEQHDSSRQFSVLAASLTSPIMALVVSNTIHKNVCWHCGHGTFTIPFCSVHWFQDGYCQTGSHWDFDWYWTFNFEINLSLPMADW